MNKGGLQVSFSWLFAILVGGFILFLAIYSAIKITETGGEASSAKTGKEIGALLNPLETGFESAQIVQITMPVETILHNRCDDFGIFGEQIIRASQKNFGKWAATDIDSKFQNKYIFSEQNVQGKEYLIFSKPFNFPFKVADLVYLTSSRDNYCFKEAPEKVVKEIGSLEQSNIHLSNCPQNSLEVCFSSDLDNCEIQVDYNSKEVRRNGTTLFFDDDALMYAAIFSEPSIYECQVRRLMGRTSELSKIYIDKSNLVSNQGCDSQTDLFSLKSLAENLRDSEDIFNVALEAERVKKDNDLSECNLW